MPGKFVFPGGRIEPTDRLMATSAPLHAAPYRAADAARAARRAPTKAAGFALAAVRETYEETGLMLGARTDRRHRRRRPAPGKHSPRPASCPISARSISSPAPSRRRSGRCASTAASSPPMSPRSRIAPRAWSGPTRNSSNWSGCRSTQARSLDMPGITAVVLEELQDRIAAGMSHDHPVPLYRMLHKRFVREIL